MFSQQEAVARAQQWANETGERHLVYQEDRYFLATPLERYQSDPQGYRRCHVIELIEPEKQVEQKDCDPT